MWTRMHKKKQRRDAFHIPAEGYPELYKLPSGITQMVADAVKQYNDMVSLSRHFDGKNVNELLIKEAEEEDTKVFLEGIFDIVQMRE
jgi:hypothetical protein